MANKSVLSQNFVGVIDSGVGGLTILQKLQEQYPNCNYVYLADSVYCPYGTKPFEQIFARVCKLVEFLQRNGALAVVLACNTASIFAGKLREKFSLPIYDVIAPTCKVVAAMTRTKRVALLATNATVKSGAYSERLNNCGVTVVLFPCSSFVPFVENNLIDTADCEEVIAASLGELPHCNVDTVILGCTHFPVLKNKIAPYVNGAKIIECCTDFQPFFSSIEKPAKTLFFTTGVRKTANLASRWYGKIQFEHVDI
ncbi:MAG: glutamate racemase [Clostridiales bacterium]|nr:glutamate racemase [Clostridiales bacterium]